MYTTLKFVHVLASIVWLGSAFALLVLTSRTVRARNYTGATALAAQSETLGRAIFGPAAMVTLVAGVAMVVVGRLSFTDAWIGIGLVGVAVSFVLGAVLSERAARQLRSVLPSEQPADVTAEVDHGAIDRVRRRLVLISGLDLTVLTVVVWAMVAKPGI
jgi:uncharacterized membrane protein